MYTKVGIFLIIVMLGGLSCSVSRTTSSPSREGEYTGPDHQNVPRILFLDYLMIYDEVNESRSVALNQMILSDGTLKEIKDHAYNPQEYDLVFSLLDQNNKEIHRQIIQDPLRRVVEFDDGDGNLRSRTIQSDSAHFFVRLQLHEQAAAVHIQQISGNGNPNIHLLSSQIQ